MKQSQVIVLIMSPRVMPHAYVLLAKLHIALPSFRLAFASNIPELPFFGMCRGRRCARQCQHRPVRSAAVTTRLPVYPHVVSVSYHITTCYDVAAVTSIQAPPYHDGTPFLIVVQFNKDVPEFTADFVEVASAQFMYPVIDGSFKRIRSVAVLFLALGWYPLRLCFGFRITSVLSMISAVQGVFVLSVWLALNHRLDMCPMPKLALTAFLRCFLTVLVPSPVDCVTVTHRSVAIP